MTDLIRTQWTTKTKRVPDRYQVIGFISSGTYGKVYKAIPKSISPNTEISQDGNTNFFAIKRFKPEREGDPAATGISQSAIREMALCAELHNSNVVHHIETILHDKTIFMVFVYCSHDLLQMIQLHGATYHTPIPADTNKSIMYQLLKGCWYLHQQWVMHRDLKPANIMVTKGGQVMIGDLGLARIFKTPLVSLYDGDKVVVTIWYRAPELLLGAKHYTTAVDTWAIGCIFGELLSLRPIFKGEEVKMENKKQVPFQKHQMQKIMDIMGKPHVSNWPLLKDHPEAHQLHTMHVKSGTTSMLPTWFGNMKREQWYADKGGEAGAQALDLLSKLLQYDPTKRLTAEQALQHPYFEDMDEELKVNCFPKTGRDYPERKIHSKEAEGSAATFSTTTKRSANVIDAALSGRPSKRLKD